MENKKKNILNFSDDFLNSLTKMEKLKLPVIVVCNLIFFISFFGLGALLIYEGLTWNEYLPMGILCIFNGFLYLSSIILIKKEKIKLGTMITTFGILIAVMMILDICPTSDNPLVYYRSGCFLAVMAVFNQVVSIRRKQMIIFDCVVPFLWIAMIIKTFPVTSHEMVATISSIGINSLGDFMAIFLVTTSNKFNVELLQGEINAEQNASKNLQAITQVLEDSRNGLSVGQKLVDETQKASTNFVEINDLYAGITKEATGLSNDAAAVSKSSNLVLDKAEKMQETVSNQNELISETSDALIKISGNISELSSIAEQRSSNMKSMMDTLNSEQKLIQQIVDQVQQVQESSNGIAGFVKTVNTIASQTNLLAMNASIEASHAGVVGKGFAVIAHEIRSLSQQTAKNASQITDELNKNSEIVQSTTESVESFNQYILNTTKEMSSTIEMMEQLISGIQAIDTENRKVMESLKIVVNQSKDTNVIADDVVKEMTVQDETLNKMRSLADGLKTNVNAMNQQLMNIQEVISVIDSEAEKNIEVTKKINNSLE